MTGRSNGRPRTDLLAIVDLGSAAVRFIIARLRPSARYRILVEERVPTRLGGGAPGTLPARAIARTLRAVHRFFRRYAPRGRGPRVVAIATSAVRDARNRERLLDPLRRDEGIEVRVLSARDEARLGVAAALESLAFRDALVADLGGASLQLSRVRARRIVSMASLPLGAVRSTHRFLRHDPPTRQELRAFREIIRERLRPALPAAERGDPGPGAPSAIRQHPPPGHPRGAQAPHGPVPTSPTSPRSASGRACRRRRKI
jgi:exopolyphosphatase/guanosine-5'-triphosphate,3'-diphosphate pyrophosphatase